MQEFDYEIFEENGVKKARVQSAGVVSLDRDGSKDEVIKNYIKSTLNVDEDDIQLNEKDSVGGDVITSAETDTKSKKESDPVEDVKRKR